MAYALIYHPLASPEGQLRKLLPSNEPLNSVSFGRMLHPYNKCIY